MGDVWIRSKQDPDVTREVPERDGNVLVKLGRWEYMTTALEAGPPPCPRESLGLAETIEAGPFTVPTPGPRKRGRPRKVKAE